jgi:hypothetical protein
MGHALQVCIRWHHVFGRVKAESSAFGIGVSTRGEHLDVQGLSQGSDPTPTEAGSKDAQRGSCGQRLATVDK